MDVKQKLIDANELLKSIRDDYTINGAHFARIRRHIEDAAEVDASPVRHGQWKTNSDRPDTLICSVCKCGFDMWKHDPHNFCPNCGAKMDGGAD